MAAELTLFALAKSVQTASPSRDCPASQDLGIPSLLKLLRLKSTVASNNAKSNLIRLIEAWFPSSGRLELYAVFPDGKVKLAFEQEA